MAVEITSIFAASVDEFHFVVDFSVENSSLGMSVSLEIVVGFIEVELFSGLDGGVDVGFEGFIVKSA